jgi:hypothetical protein
MAIFNLRVLRAGAWFVNAIHLRSAHRDEGLSGGRGDRLAVSGFRLLQLWEFPGVLRFFSLALWRVSLRVKRDGIIDGGKR